MLPEGNIYLLDYVLKNLPPEGSVVEIGSYGGLSTNLICYLLRKYNQPNLFYSCDAWIYEGYDDHTGVKSAYMDGRTDVTRTDYTNYIKNAFIQSTRLLSKDNLPFSFHMASALFAEKWQNAETAGDVFDRAVKLGGAICFAYIDGDHSLEAAGKDFEFISKHLVKGGYILFDDSANGMSFGSATLMKQVKQDKNYEVILKNPNYLVRKK
jgi:hypothetical protein